MTRRLAVIGGDAGGMSAAAQARRTDPTLEIVAFERGAHTSYSACGIPYVVSGLVDDLEDLVVRTPQQHRDVSRIDVRTNHEVVGVDLAARRLEVRDHAHNRTIQVPFDDLLVATGSTPIRPDLPGIDLPFIRGVQTLDDAEALLRDATADRCKNVVVVGGGYIGLEMAEAFVERGMRVAVVEAADHVMGTLDGDMAQPIEDAMRALGIDLRVGTPVTGFADRLVQTDSGPLLADLVVLGLGVAPQSSVAADAGIELGVKGAVRVDRRQRTSAEGVWSAGDCCESTHQVSGRPVHVALGTVANKQGRVAGVNIGGGYATFPGVLGTAITRVCSTEVARTGLSEREATDAGFVPVAAKIESTTVSSYLPDAPRVTVKLVAEKHTGRVLGAQIVGGRGAAKRIDVLATAITARMDVDQVAQLDLSYAPPFSPLWDPVLTAAKQVAPLV
jgi:NADPH-dependent 2,4-dienoyl-CoA reductase/sulfur reductase-like enzyme